MDCRSHSSGGTATHGGIRFPSVGIGQGDTIDSATFSGWVINAARDDPHLDIKGDDQDDAPTFTSGANDINNRTPTTASVAWSTTDIGSGSYINAPELKTIVQEIVDIATWSSGNALALLFLTRTDIDNRYYTIRAHDNGSDIPQFDIDYTAAAAVKPWWYYQRNAMRRSC